MIIKAQAIHILYPNVASVRGDEAFDINGNKIEYDNSVIESYINAEKYKDLRANEYPSITDYIDGIVKGDNAQVQAYIDACLAVKAKYPKGNQ